MYEEFYKLDRAPFDTTPDPTFFFMSDGHQEALAALVYGIDRRKGFISMIGEVGTGKTTVLRAYIESEHVKNTRMIYLFNPRVSYEDLLLMVLRELRVEIPEGETKRVDLLHRVLVNEYKNGHNVVLIVDEAQNIPPETLESMRMLSNLETSSEKLIQIVLSGQPELDDLLNSNRLRQLRQRIAVKVRLEALSREEAGEYVRYRLRRAGGDDGVFTKDAIDWVVRCTGGNPRSINVLCDNALITGYGYQQFPISTPIIKEIAKDFDIRSLSGSYGVRSDNWFRAAASVLALGGIAGLAYLAFMSRDKDADDSAMADVANNTEQAVELRNDDGQKLDSAAEVNAGDTGAVVVQSEEMVKIDVGDGVSIPDSSDNAVTELPLDSDAAPSDSAAADSTTQATGTVVEVDEGAEGQRPKFESVVIQTESTQSDQVDKSDNTQETTSTVSASSAENESAQRVPRQTDTQLTGVTPAQPISEAITQQKTALDTTAAGVSANEASNAQQQGNSQAVTNGGDDSKATVANTPPTVVIVNGVQRTIDSSGRYLTTDSTEASPGTPSEAATDTSPQPQLATAESAPQAASPEQAVRIVTSGDNLWDMAKEVYGRVNERIVARVMESNPNLETPGSIYVGQKIVFPEL